MVIPAAQGAHGGCPAEILELSTRDEAHLQVERDLTIRRRWCLLNVRPWHIAVLDVCDGTSAVGESRHRIPRRIRWFTFLTLKINVQSIHDQHAVPGVVILRPRPFEPRRWDALSCNYRPEGARGVTSALRSWTASFHGILCARSRTVEGEATQDVPL